MTIAGLTYLQLKKTAIEKGWYFFLSMNCFFFNKNYNFFCHVAIHGEKKKISIGKERLVPEHLRNPIFCFISFVFSVKLIFFFHFYFFFCTWKYFGTFFKKPFGGYENELQLHFFYLCFFFCLMCFFSYALNAWRWRGKKNKNENKKKIKWRKNCLNTTTTTTTTLATFLKIKSFCVTCKKIKTSNPQNIKKIKKVCVLKNGQTNCRMFARECTDTKWF